MTSVGPTTEGFVMDVNCGHSDHSLSANASKCLGGSGERRARLHEVVKEHDVRRAGRLWIDRSSLRGLGGARSEWKVLQLRTGRRSEHLEKWRPERIRGRSDDDPTGTTTMSRSQSRNRALT